MKAGFFFACVLLMACGSKKEEQKDYSWLDQSRFDAKADIAKGDIHLINFGLHFPIPEEDSLTKQYGFYFDERGCAITDTEIKLEKMYNDQVIKHLEERNGKGWYDRFCLVYDSLNKVMWDQINDTTKKVK